MKTTGGHDRAGRISALKRGAPYPVRIRGVAAKKVVDETIEVWIVDSAQLERVRKRSCCSSEHVGLFAIIDSHRYPLASSQPVARYPLLVVLPTTRLWFLLFVFEKGEPPIDQKVAPVTASASFEHRNATAAATCSAV